MSSVTKKLDLPLIGGLGYSSSSSQKCYNGGCGVAAGYGGLHSKVKGNHDLTSPPPSCSGVNMETQQLLPTPPPSLHPLSFPQHNPQQVCLRHQANVYDVAWHLLLSEELKKLNKFRTQVKKWFVLYDDTHNPIGRGSAPTGGGDVDDEDEADDDDGDDVDMGNTRPGVGENLVLPPYIPAHLEYHDSEKKWRMGKPPNKDFVLRECFNIYRKKDRDSLNKFVIGVCTLKDTLDIIFEKEQDMLVWLEMLLSCQMGGRSSQGRIPRPIYEHMWEVNVKGFKPESGSSSTFQMTGTHRLVVSQEGIKFFEIGSDKPKVFPINSLRGYGCGGSYFKLEIGRISISGGGVLDVDCRGPKVAEQVDLTVRKVCNSSSDDTNYRNRSNSRTFTSSRHHLTSTSSSTSKSSRSRESVNTQGSSSAAAAAAARHLPGATASSSGFKQSAAKAATTTFTSMTEDTYRPRSESWSNPTMSHSLTGSKNILSHGPPRHLQSASGTTARQQQTARPVQEVHRHHPKDHRYRTTSEGNHFDLKHGRHRTPKSVISGSPISPGSYVSSAESAGSSNSIDGAGEPYPRYSSSIVSGGVEQQHPSSGAAATIFEESSAESWVDPVIVQKEMDEVSRRPSSTSRRDLSGSPSRNNDPSSTAIASTSPSSGVAYTQVECLTNLNQENDDDDYDDVNQFNEKMELTSLGFLPGTDPALVAMNSRQQRKPENLFVLSSSPVNGSDIHYTSIVHSQPPVTTEPSRREVSHKHTTTAPKSSSSLAMAIVPNCSESADYIVMSPPAFSGALQSGQQSGNSSHTNSLKRRSEGMMTSLEREQKRLSVLGLDETTSIAAATAAMTSSVTSNLSSSLVASSPHGSQSSYSNPLVEGQYEEGDAAAYALMSPTGDSVAAPLQHSNFHSRTGSNASASHLLLFSDTVDGGRSLLTPPNKVEGSSEGGGDGSAYVDMSPSVAKNTEIGRRIPTLLEDVSSGEAGKVSNNTEDQTYLVMSPVNVVDGIASKGGQSGAISSRSSATPHKRTYQRGVSGDPKRNSFCSEVDVAGGGGWWCGNNSGDGNIGDWQSSSSVGGAAVPINDEADDVYVHLCFGGSGVDRALPPQDHGFPSQTPIQIPSSSRHVVGHRGVSGGRHRMSPSSSSCSVVSGTPNSCTDLPVHNRRRRNPDDDDVPLQEDDHHHLHHYHPSESRKSSRVYCRPMMTVSSSTSSLGSSIGVSAAKSNFIDIPNSRSRQSPGGGGGNSQTQADGKVSASSSLLGNSPNMMASRLSSWFRNRTGSVPARPVFKGRQRHRTQSEGEKDTNPSVPASAEPKR